MNIVKQISVAAYISIVFLLLHMLMAYFHLSDVTNLVISLVLMLSAQLVAFVVLKKNHSSKNISFKAIFTLLCLTQCFAIILLTLNSAFNPFTEKHTVNFTEVFFSLMIFGGILPLTISALLWYAWVKKKHNVF